MLTRVRQRLVREREQRRGRKIDPAWAHRKRLLRGYNALSKKGRGRLAGVFATDDSTDELSAAWGVKEQLRRLIASAHIKIARTEKMISGCYVLAADMDETWRLWPPLGLGSQRVLITYRVTNACIEAANTGNTSNAPAADTEILPIPSPYPAHQRRPTRGVNPSTRQGTTIKGE